MKTLDQVLTEATKQAQELLRLTEEHAALGEQQQAEVFEQYEIALLACMHRLIALQWVLIDSARSLSDESAGSMASTSPTPNDMQYAALVLQLAALGQRRDLSFTKDQRTNLVFLLEQAVANVQRSITPHEEEQRRRREEDDEERSGSFTFDGNEYP